MGKITETELNEIRSIMLDKNFNIEKLIEYTKDKNLIKQISGYKRR